MANIKITMSVTLTQIPDSTGDKPEVDEVAAELLAELPGMEIWLEDYGYVVESADVDAVA